MQRMQRLAFFTGRRMVSSGLGDPGSGAGRGGGSGGSVRDAGGAFGKLEAAREEEYFYKLQRAQLKELKAQIAREIEHHEQQAKNHSEVIERHKKRIAELESEEKGLK
ncbi:unnamed protein product [Bursaphelenchus xylophilus]|uniref:ATPase inhibitor, mitochondrial n=1 Tax=Bursaphelenchus xylophilus TaxID=6326 RepID=A0A1I7RWL7_BURXY|nr:unnamed protein product [Bursaphelenchus xylophilus]CAG9128480.1 unnamed protein product [Bursaphelenchus xylophilus]